jgi:hypothetical protein
MTYLYDEETGSIALASVKKSVVEYDLNTVDPGGANDASLPRLNHHRGDS